MIHNIDKMTPEQRAERLKEMKAKLAARTDGAGQPLPGFGDNVRLLKDEIEEMEERK